jgi:hypothetical protein
LPNAFNISSPAPKVQVQIQVQVVIALLVLFTHIVACPEGTKREARTRNRPSCQTLLVVVPVLHTGVVLVCNSFSSFVFRKHKHPNTFSTTNANKHTHTHTHTHTLSAAPERHHHV